MSIDGVTSAEGATMSSLRVRLSGSPAATSAGSEVGSEASAWRVLPAPRRWPKSWPPRGKSPLENRCMRCNISAGISPLFCSQQLADPVLHGCGQGFDVHRHLGARGRVHLRLHRRFIGRRYALLPTGKLCGFGSGQPRFDFQFGNDFRGQYLRPETSQNPVAQNACSAAPHSARSYSG